MKSLLTLAHDFLLNLGRALKPKNLQKEVDEAKQFAKDRKEKVAANKAKLEQLRELAHNRSTGYSHSAYDSNLN